MPHVSIIMTAYNHTDYIADTIESVLAQTHTDWTLYIGDDSPDTRTWEIIQQYVAKYPDKVKAYRNIPALGIVGNMNMLLRNIHIDTRYITILEGDDMYIPENLAKKIDIFTTYPDVGLVYSDYQTIDHIGCIISPYIANASHISFSRISHEKWCMGGNIYRGIMSYSNFAVRRDILHGIGDIMNPSTEKNFAVSDVDLQFRIMQVAQVYHIPEVLFGYRILANSFSRNGSIYRDMDILTTYWYKQGYISSIAYRRILRDILGKYILYSVRRGYVLQVISLVYRYILGV